MMRKSLPCLARGAVLTVAGALWMGAAGTALADPILTPVSVTASGPYSNSLSLLNDGFVPAQGTTWNLSQTVWWDGTSTYFTFNYGVPVELTGLFVSADNNDTYTFQYSSDDVSWSPLSFIVPSDGTVQDGTDIFSSYAGPYYTPNLAFSPVVAQYLRVTAINGDNDYALGEVQASGIDIPEPSSLSMLAAGMAGLALMRRRRGLTRSRDEKSSS